MHPARTVGPSHSLACANNLINCVVLYQPSILRNCAVLRIFIIFGSGTRSMLTAGSAMTNVKRIKDTDGRY
jgi:hypothetical protein